MFWSAVIGYALEFGDLSPHSSLSCRLVSIAYGAKPPKAKAVRAHRFSKSALLIAPVALAGWNFGLRRVSHVLGQRATLIIRFFELAFIIAPHVTLVGACVYQFALGVSAFIWHLTLLYPV
jgi:hypothetical protein